MRRKHAIAISALLALAAVVGTVAVTKTVALGQSSATPTASELHARAARLEQAEAELRTSRDLMPPALPPLPAAGAGTAIPQTAPAAPTQAIAVVGDHEGEHELGEDGWEHEHDDD